MKVLIWHGYLLGGTGSNVYTRALARAWSRLGHEVVVFCQEPHPEEYDLGGATVVRPPLDGPLPVFVLDRYEDMEARYLQDLTAAPSGITSSSGTRPPCASTCRPTSSSRTTSSSERPSAPRPECRSPSRRTARSSSSRCAGTRSSAPGRARALALRPRFIAGSEHIRAVLAEVVGWTERVRVVPPGVDVEEFRPEPRDEALAALLEEAGRDSAPASERDPDAGNAERLGEFLAGEAPTVVYVGKLSEEKGVHLLLEALAHVDARAVVVGFGPAREELERAAGERVLFTGALEHRHLRHLWPLADVSVTPSVFPEAFGMVAAEAAACGSPPLVARHSGLAEVAEGLEAAYPEEHRALASFKPGDAADLAAKLDAILALPRPEWARLSSAARAAAVERWSWETIAALILSPRG